MRKFLHEKEELVVLIAVILAGLFGVLLARAWPAEPTKAPPPKVDALADCRDNLSVTTQYALQQQRARAQAEQDLARAMARVVQLEEQVAGKTKTK